MFEYDLNIRVRYSDTDQMGAVYYGNYASYYEVARVESLRSLGIVYKDLEEQGIMMPVLENYSKFIAPAKYDDLLTLSVSIKEKPGIRITFHYEIKNESSKVINIGYSTLVFVDKNTGKPRKPPEEIDEVLNKYFK